MNTVFALAFICGFAFIIASDRSLLKSVSLQGKVIYYGFNVTTLGLFTSKLLGYSIPMPTTLFIHTLSPWFLSLLHP